MVLNTDQLASSESIISVLFDPLRITRPFSLFLAEYSNVTHRKMYRNKDQDAENWKLTQLINLKSKKVGT